MCLWSSSSLMMRSSSSRRTDQKLCWIYGAGLQDYPVSTSLRNARFLSFSCCIPGWPVLFSSGRWTQLSQHSHNCSKSDDASLVAFLWVVHDATHCYCCSCCCGGRQHQHQAPSQAFALALALALAQAQEQAAALPTLLPPLPPLPPQPPPPGSSP